MAPFKYYVRSTLLIGSILFATAYAAGVVQKFATDTLQIGAPGADNKELIFDTGDGVSNAKISVDDASPSFTLNKNVDVTGSFTQTGNSLIFGDGLGTNKSLIFNAAGGTDPLIRWNQAETAIEFSNDGTNFRKIGSGSGGGGGINLLGELGADFEAGTPPSNWTASGGTFVEDITTPIFDKKSGVWDASALSQTLTSATKVIERGMIGRKCSANIYYRYTGAADDIQFQVRLNGSSTIAEAGLAATTGTNVTQGQLFFDCPAIATDTLSVRLLANVSNPSAITVDNAFVGSDKNTFQLSQAELLAEVYWPATASCNLSVDSGSFTNLTTTAACPPPIKTAGTLSITDSFTDTMSIRLNDVPQGIIEGFVTMQFEHPTGGTHVAIRLFESTTSTGGRHCQTKTDSAIVDQIQVTCPIVVNNPSTQNLVFRAQMAEGGAGSALWLNDTGGAGGRETRMVFTKYPSVSAEALNIETTGWKVDANIGGANPGLGSASQASYIGIDDAGLDLVNNPGSGNITAQIPCSGTNPPTGLTCAAGNESVGVSFPVPQAGDVLACATFGAEIFTGASGTLSGAFQIVETPNDAQTITQEGKGRITFQNRVQNTVVNQPIRICGNFNFASAGQKTLRLMYEQSTTPTILTNILLLDRAGSAGQRDIHWEVYPLNQQMPAPVFTALKNKLNVGAENWQMRHAGLTCAASSSIGSQGPSSWISSLGNVSTGCCTITLTGTTTVGFRNCTSSVQATTTQATILNNAFVSDTTLNICAADAAGLPINSGYSVNLNCLATGL